MTLVRFILTANIKYHILEITKKFYYHNECASRTSGSFCHEFQSTNGFSPVWEFLESLRTKSVSNKDARIQYKQATLYIQLLEDNGTHLPENITKHIEDDIRELRPGNNRIFYFYYRDDTYVLLHSFRKKTQKTPKREIIRAKAERDDYHNQKENI